MEKEETRSNKKIILIVFGILVILVIGAIIWVALSDKNEKSKTEPASKTESDSISVQCQKACEIKSIYGFCSAERKVNDELKTTCDELSKNPSYAKYNVGACPEISCETQESDQTCVSGLGGTWEFPIDSEGCSQGGTKIRRQVTPSDEPPIEGQICCR